MSGIFISYRRDDSAAYAGRLFDRLEEYFGRDHIFMDIDHIEPGEDFIEVIQKKLDSIDIAIVIIGKQWLDITDTGGHRRLDDLDDFVRLEIAAILERKKRAIPILVGGAVVPKSSQLPDVLAPLVRRNAFEISDTRFHSDVDNLIKALEKVLTDLNPSKLTQTSVNRPANSKLQKSWVITTILLGIILVFGSYIFEKPENFLNPGGMNVGESKSENSLIVDTSEIMVDTQAIPVDSESIQQMADEETFDIEDDIQIAASFPKPSKKTQSVQKIVDVKSPKNAKATQSEFKGQTVHNLALKEANEAVSRMEKEIEELQVLIDSKKPAQVQTDAQTSQIQPEMESIEVVSSESIPEKVKNSSTLLSPEIARSESKQKIDVQRMVISESRMVENNLLSPKIKTQLIVAYNESIKAGGIVHVAYPPHTRPSVLKQFVDIGISNGQDDDLKKEFVVYLARSKNKINLDSIKK